MLNVNLGKNLGIALGKFCRTGPWSGWVPLSPCVCDWAAVADAALTTTQGDDEPGCTRPLCVWLGPWAGWVPLCVWLDV